MLDAEMEGRRLLGTNRQLPNPRTANASLDDIRLKLSQARLHCRNWAKAQPDALRGDIAAMLSHRALEAFAHEATPPVRLSCSLTEPSVRLDHAADILACEIGKTASALPLSEALYIVTSLYPALLPEGDRSVLGAYYTPPALVMHLLDRAGEEGVAWRTARVLDPAAGAGAFLVPAAMRMRAAMCRSEPAVVLAEIGTRLLGMEIDPHAASLAQAALEIALADLSEASGHSIPRLVRVCNALDESPQESFDLVVGNPPYGRVKLTAEMRRRYGRSLYGHANLYGIFTDLALRWTRPEGVIAYLTPTSFLSGQYYAALRSLLATEAPPTAIDFVHARRGVFEDVLQETLLAVYQKGGRRHRRAQIHYLHVANEREASVTRNGTVGLPLHPSAPWLAPRDRRHSALIAGVEKMPARLADWGYAVSTGPLVWNRFKSQLRGSADEPAVHPLVWAESIAADGRFEFRARKKNHAPYFKLKACDGWLLVREPCVLVQRTTAKEQTRRLIAAELPNEFVERHGGVVVENHLNMVRAMGAPTVPPAVVAALFNSRAVDELFRCMNGSVAVSAFELEALPLPSPTELGVLKRLVAEGAGRSHVEAECNRLYGEPS